MLAGAREVVSGLGALLSPVEFAYAFVAPHRPPAGVCDAAEPARWPDAAEVERTFVRLFPAQADTLRRAVRHAAEKGRHPLASEEPERSSSEAIGELEAALLVDSPVGQALVSRGREEAALTALAFPVARSLSAAHANVSRELSPSGDSRTWRRRLQRFCEKQRLTLLEDSWKWIQREQDAEVLEIAFHLAMCERWAPGLRAERLKALAERRACVRILEIVCDDRFLEDMMSWTHRMRELRE